MSDLPRLLVVKKCEIDLYPECHFIYLAVKTHNLIDVTRPIMAGVSFHQRSALVVYTLSTPGAGFKVAGGATQAAEKRVTGVVSGVVPMERSLWRNVRRLQTGGLGYSGSWR
ncbi:hypothetical protein [Entomohabitans teleogrylli]|uniref:hypothetical protein n=1 Tax=Entomohabitans teleogrylli TaxID=1384589 RepID=UPI0012B69EDF|nr:hypothetical protein [Entomohabitans teleogrylli]